MSAPFRFVHVGFEFASGTPPMKDLETVFNLAKDWVRYGAHCWILYTKTSLDTWRDRIRKSSAITEEDSFFLCEFDPETYSGYQSEMVWEWLARQRNE